MIPGNTGLGAGRVEKSTGKGRKLIEGVLIVSDHRGQLELKSLKNRVQYMHQNHPAEKPGRPLCVSAPATVHHLLNCFWECGHPGTSGLLCAGSEQLSKVPEQVLRHRGADVSL